MIEIRLRLKNLKYKKSQIPRPLDRPLLTSEVNSLNTIYIILKTDHFDFINTLSDSQ